MAQAYQCDKCRTFYTGDPYTLAIHDVTGAVLLQQDICEQCKAELESLFTKSVRSDVVPPCSTVTSLPSR